jgi:1-acyl-sn-glycerol-3-phosphate acyltransferase
MMRLVLRWVIMAIMVPSFLVLTARDRCDPWDPRGRRRAAIRGCRWSRRGCRVLDFRVCVHGRRRGGHPWPGRLVVANHLGWIDPIALAAVAPVTFVTSTDVQRMGWVGRVAAGGGCVFVERRNRRQAADDMQRLQQLLMAGLPVVVYPEGTSSDGTGILPFKSTLLEAAIAAGCPIQPLCLQPETVDGRPIRRHHQRDRICYYGDMGFLPHMLRTLAGQRLGLTFHVLPPLAPGDDRKQLSDTLHQQLSAAYRPLLPTPSPHMLTARNEERQLWLTSP